MTIQRSTLRFESKNDVFVCVWVNDKTFFLVRNYEFMNKMKRHSAPRAKSSGGIFCGHVKENLLKRVINGCEPLTGCDLIETSQKKIAMDGIYG